VALSKLNGGSYSHQKEQDMDFEDFLEEDNEDVMIRMEHEDGTKVTFLTAPPEVFTQTEELEPLVYGIGDKDVCVAFNSELIERMIAESVEKNGETYGAQASAFLPITMILNKGLKAVDKYLKDQK
jgi:hypothetical protein